MSLSHLVRYALSLSPRKAAVDGGRWLKKRLYGQCAEISHRWRDTFGPAVNLDLPRRIPILDAAALAPCRDVIDRLAAQALAHEFDLLGSGLTRVAYGMMCPGVEGHRFAPVAPPRPGHEADDLVARLAPGNRRRAMGLRRMVSADYQPIDWQIDFKSGYRWREGRWSGTVQFAHHPGVDVKVPWELGRLQHLVHLALAFAQAPGDGDRYVREFRDQGLDFMAANPPGFGVNWACTMDVAIRAANLVLARDILIAHGAVLGGPFEGEFSASLIAHGRFIASHLEWKAAGRGNHYLADVVGLLFTAAFLPPSPETDRWLAFAVRAVIAEIEDQFSADGTNIEASTGYHRLSAEMAIYAAALILGLSDDRVEALATYDHRQWRHHPALPAAAVVALPLPGAVADRLERMVEFTIQATKPNRRVVQVGDTDNGRLFKVCPLMDDDVSEAHLDHRALAAAGRGLFERPDFAEFAGPGLDLETRIVAGLAAGKGLPAARPVPARSMARRSAPPAPARDSSGDEAIIGVTVPDAAVLAGLETVAYPDFGLFIWRGPRFFLSVRCGRLHADLHGGHAHNDQLAIELSIDGEDWLADPGTGLYTASQRTRNAYRSALAHAVPRHGDREPAPLDGGYFRLDDRARAECLAFDRDHFHGIHWGFGQPAFRMIDIEPDGIRIHDGIGVAGPGAAPPSPTVVGSGEELRRLFGLTLPFARGYGAL